MHKELRLFIAIELMADPNASIEKIKNHLKFTMAAGLVEDRSFS